MYILNKYNQDALKCISFSPNTLYDYFFCYRHSDKMIEKLKAAGLGYNVDEDKTIDKFGKCSVHKQL